MLYHLGASRSGCQALLSDRARAGGTLQATPAGDLGKPAGLGTVGPPLAAGSINALPSLGRGGGEGLSGYPESIAKTQREGERACGAWARVGYCGNGHAFAKQLLCGREWCPTCGEEGSPAHRRRKARWYPKVQQIREMGYFVVTIPPEVRERYRTKEALGKLGSALTRLMKRHGFSRGLRRMHFFGEPNGQEAPQYHPHWNLLVEAGHLQKAKLEAIKQDLARVLGVDLDRVNARYGYTSDPRRMLHRVKYVTRATFRVREWDEDLAGELWGFRNGSTWGKWEGPRVWEIPEEGESCHETRLLAALEEGRCPHCGDPVHWGDVFSWPAGWGRVWEDLGAGYWARGRFDRVLVKGRGG